MLRCLALLALALSTPALAGSWGKDASAGWGKSSDTAEVSVGKRLSVGDPVVVGALALYPVLDRDATSRPEVEAVPLSEAMATGQVQVREVQNGVVAQVQMVNLGEDPVLVVVCDVIRGGMQDRVVTQSQLIASGQPTRVPVHCVERGRWTDPHGGVFAYGGRVDPLLRQVIQRAASQDATWAAVAQANEARGVDGAASWLRGASVDPRQVAGLEASLKQRFQDDKRVVGVVVARNGRFEGSEVYAHPELFARDRLNVLRGTLAAAPATAVAATRGVPTAYDAAAFLEESLAD